MKSLTKKISIGVLSGLFAVGAVGAGISALALNGNGSSDGFTPLATNLATTSTTTVKASMVEDHIVPGGTVTFELNLTTTDKTTRWSAVDIRFAPLALTADGYVADTELAQYFSVPGEAKDSLDMGVLSDYSKYKNTACTSFFTNPDQNGKTGYFRIVITAEASSNLDDYVSTASPVTLSLTLNVSKEIEQVASIREALERGENPELTFGIVENMVSKVTTKAATYVNSSGIPEYGRLWTTNCTGDIIKAHSETDITDITVTVDDVDDDGNPTERTEVLDVDPLNPHDVLNVLLGDTPERKVHIDPPTLTEDSAGAKVSAGATNDPTRKPSTMLPMTDEGVDVPLTDTNHYIYVEVVSEDGSKTEHYPINAVYTYARLDSLTVSVSTPSVSGYLIIEPEFDRDTFTYTVKYPSDASLATLSATVLQGYNANNTIAISANICTIAGGLTEFASGGVVRISGADKTAAQVILTVYSMASDLHLDGNAYKQYTVNFEKSSVDTGIEPITVTSVNSGNEASNQADKALEEGVDYYFAILDSNPQAKMTLTLVGEATATISGESLSETPYDPDNVYEIGTYTITVTAEAGNTQTYTIMFAKFDSIQLIDTDYEFLFEELTAYGPITFSKRMSYTARGMEHGVDDIDFERVVLGHVRPDTTVKSFLSHFPEEQQQNFRLYNAYDALVFENGVPQAPYDNLFDSDFLSVGTGWRLEYGTGDAADIIYISVLGDLDSDGHIMGDDVNVMYSAIMNLTDLSKKEFMFASYVENGGQLDATDVNVLYMIIMNLDSVENHYTYY